MRLFIAVPLKEQVKAQVEKIQTRLAKSAADVKWVNPVNLHLTLKFLGETQPDKIGVIDESLNPEIVKFPAFQVRFDVLGAFPGITHPRVVWLAGSQGIQQLVSLAGVIEQQLVSRSFPAEDRPFTAHLTIGRVRSPRGLKKLSHFLDEPKLAAPLLIDVQEVHLIQSTLSPRGPDYKTIINWPLTTG